MGEKLFVLTETQLVSMLTDQMKLDALERAGVDNWCWYGENFPEIQEMYCPDSDISEENLDDLTFWDVAKMRVDAGEFRELVTFDNLEED
jgi:hypothetical protein